MTEKIKKQWSVMRFQGKGAGNRGTFWFDSREEADAEAVRIAGRNPGMRYIVLEVVGTVIVPSPPVEVVRV